MLQTKSFCDDTEKKDNEVYFLDIPRDSFILMFCRNEHKSMHLKHHFYTPIYGSNRKQLSDVSDVSLFKGLNN